MKKLKLFGASCLLLLLGSTPMQAESWNDGVFVYNTQYTKSTGNVINLPEKEVAISLYMKNNPGGVTVKDTIYYEKLSNVPSVLKSSGKIKEPGSTGTSGGYTYTYLGTGNYLGTNVGKLYYYCTREYTLTNYSVADIVTIPATVEHNEKEYDVVAIQKWGFCYLQNDCNPIPVCIIGEPEKRDLTNINDHRNDYLKQVRFAEGTKVRSIGDYAFMSCTQLESIIIPNTVEELGQGIFECCKALTDCRFQTVTDETDPKYGQVRFTTIPNWTFWFCTGMKSLELPDGITTIEGMTAGASLQYMTSLISIRLPNTLTTIGPHFLCCAMSLKTIVIPASVTNIDGALFHGCENLSEGYLLGDAASLVDRREDASPFSRNNAMCAGQVHDCTFYVPGNYMNDYVTDPVWQKVDAAHNTVGNKFDVIAPETREFAQGKWVTAIFPNEVIGYKSDSEEGFGVNARVAKLTSVAVDEKNPNFYHMTFTLIDGENIPAALPVLICPSKVATHTMYTEAQAASVDFKLEMTKEHPVAVKAGNGAVVSMKGKYMDYKLMPWDYYFKNNKFYRVADAASAATVRQCRCYWTLDVSGVKEDMGGGASAKFIKPDASGIADVKVVNAVIDAVYDLQGRKLDIPASALPEVIFIVNGKKVLVK